MTSGTLRTILIVGAAVGVVSIAACKATVTTNGTDSNSLSMDNGTITLSTNATSTNTALSASNGAMNATATAPTNAPMSSGGNSTAR